MKAVNISWDFMDTIVVARAQREHTQDKTDSG